MNIDNFSSMKNLLQSIERVLQSGLIIAIIIGLYFKLISYSNIILDSDSTQFGLYSYSIIHGNILFHEIYLSSSGKYFLELVIFHLLPQFISNYDPLILKLSLFLIFICAVLVFSYFVYYLTNQVTNALVFAALVLTLNSSAFSSFAEIAHMFSVFFCGIVLIVTTYFVSSTQNRVLTIKNLFLMIFLSICISIASYSDPYVILCYTIPIIGAYIFFYNTKTKFTNLLFIFITTFSLLTYLFGDWIIETIIVDPPRIVSYMPLEIRPMTQVGPYILFFFKGISDLLNINLYYIWDAVTLENCCISIVFIITAFSLLYMYLFHQNQGFRKDNFIFSYFGLTLISFFIFYIFTSMSAEGLSHLKYLLYPMLVLLILISLTISSNTKLFAILVCLIICIGIIGNIYSNQKFETDSNQKQTELIKFLNDNNLHYGYSDYWDSNLITYLSKFLITVRAITIDNNESVKTYPYNNNDNWYNYPDDADVFILTRNGNTLLTDEKLSYVLSIDPPKKKLLCNEYSIYVW